MKKNITISDKVRRTVQQVRNKYNIHGRSFTRADFRRICKGEDIRLMVMPELRVSGFIFKMKFDDRRRIVLRSLGRKQKDLFIAFHELGHFFLRHKPDTAFLQAVEGRLGKTRKEREADAFADLAIEEHYHHVA